MKTPRTILEECFKDYVSKGLNFKPAVDQSLSSLRECVLAQDCVGKNITVPKLNRDIMKDPWFVEGIKIGYNQALQDIANLFGAKE